MEENREMWVVLRRFFFFEKRKIGAHNALSHTTPTRKKRKDAV
jgi:hypothetical protein